MSISHPPVLIIVSGPPCSGKTTLGRRLAADLHLPFIHKDGIKERLFDRLGTGDLDWSSRLSRASYDLLYDFAGAILKAGWSLVTEANFRPERENDYFLELQERCPYRPVQVLCRTDGAVLLERFRRRLASPGRHPGHLDTENEANLLPVLLAGRHEPLAIGGPFFEIDTTDFAALNYDRILADLKKLADLF